MNALRRGLLLAALQVAIVASLAAKLTWDRHRLPRAWAPANGYDPGLPIRGRYVALRLEVLCDDVPESPEPPPRNRQWANPFGLSLRGNLRVENGRLVSDCSSSTEGVALFRTRQGQALTTGLLEPVLFFLPEHATDPWEMARGGELWAEVTVPTNAPPRPIRLAIKRGNSFTPLEIK
jgi:hypothetical protein